MHIKKNAGLLMKQVELVACDVDGTLARSVLYGTDGGESRCYVKRDITRIHAVQSVLNIPVLVVSELGDEITAPYFRKFRVHVVSRQELGVGEERSNWLQSRYPSNHRRTLYIGDDLQDLSMGAASLCFACPSDAAPEVRSAAHVVSDLRGGEGAVAQILAHLIGVKGKREKVVEYFLSRSA